MRTPATATKRERMPRERTASSVASDATWLLSLYVLALVLVPANLTISALGSIGTPALLIGLVAGLWWLGTHLVRPFERQDFAQPIRGGMLLFTICVLISYVAATTRPTDSLELSAADRGLLLVFSLLGVVLLTADGLTSIAHLETVLRVLVWAVAICAVIGLVQFATGAAVVDLIQIPGLTPNNALTSIYDRNGFTRAAGTSTHPIEFGVILAMTLPLALHFAFSDVARSRVVRWLPVALIGMAIPVTISRSAVLGVVVALLVLLPTWPPLRRRIAYATIIVGCAVVYTAIPGMLGTLTRLFTGITDDGSARSRTDSYAFALEFVSRSPIVGRGFSTFLPQYRILDNQYLGTLIELGLLGTLALLALFVGAFFAALGSRRLSLDPSARALAQSLAATIAAGAVSFATFDAFAFPQATGLMFLAIGSVGAVWRLSHTPYGVG